MPRPAGQTLLLLSNVESSGGRARGFADLPKIRHSSANRMALTDARPESETAGELQNWTALLIIRIL
jgi:hypothetical protein